jgi:hypothetical protein
MHKHIYYGPRCLTKCGKCEGNNCSEWRRSRKQHSRSNKIIHNWYLDRTLNPNNLAYTCLWSYIDLQHCHMSQTNSCYMMCYSSDHMFLSHRLKAKNWQSNHKGLTSSLTLHFYSHVFATDINVFSIRPV